MTDRFVLPDLPYAYDALEPWCSAETLALHHDKHHAAYVKAANAAADELDTVDPGDANRLAGLRAAYTFNVGGHVLHSLFWENLSPEAGAPSGALEARLTRDLGSVERARTLLTSACTSVKGSGWGVLAYEPLSDRVIVTSLLDHQHDIVPASHLLAVVDVWEHAYYLVHRNDRAGWVGAAVEHLDWARIGQRLDAALAATTAGAGR